MPSKYRYCTFFTADGIVFAWVKLCKNIMLAA